VLEGTFNTAHSLTQRAPSVLWPLGGNQQ